MSSSQNREFGTAGHAVTVRKAQLLQQNEWMTETRPLTAHERAVLEYLLAGDFPGLPQLRAQLPHAKYNGTWVPGSAEFFVHVDRTKCEPYVPTAPVRGGPYVEASVGEIGELGIWLEDDGYLNSLEYSWYTEEMPIELPTLDQIGTVSGGWEPWDQKLIVNLPHNRPRLRDRLMGRSMRGTGWAWGWPKRRR